MTKNKAIQLIVLGCMALMAQSCAIPTIAKKEPAVDLPQAFSPDQASTDSAAKVNWKEFFEDPYLSSLIDIALTNNKEINILMQRISVAENEILARKGEYLPSVGFGAAAETERTAKYTRNGAIEENLDIKEGKAFPKYFGNYQFGLVASWELDVWKKLRNATKVATMEYMASIEGKHFLTTNLVAEVADSYYELLALDNQLDNLDKNIQIQQHAFDVVKQLQLYGRTTSLAVKRFEAEVNKNRSQRYEVKQHIVETENRINFLLGRTPQPIERASASFMDLKPKMLETGMPSQLLENRPDIRKAQLELEAAKLNIEVAKANFYPSFALKAGLGFQAFNPRYLLNMPESVAGSLAGDIMAPLVNRNAIIATYKNASAEQIQAAFDYEQAIIKAYSEVSTQLSNIDNLDKNYQLKNSQVEALTSSIDISNQLFQSARADYMEVLLTQRDALEAKMDLIETKQKQITAMIDLYRALGGGWQ
ncbi:efflux transporter, outer membrane factor (OMF) lipoprotein, NodT family [Methylobacillus rhizosphaerae]|uniref:Efflux transporter, outer membrane factor (OMF) lipoprotein, NodT family n=2 Tax=Methylobacillus rhizosphaerae TaxID=551994 RepID=A0A239A2X3_9PROT|nr:efflux transporter, outer membrane factor (OMF) lipoprotein, NodT family [Methylobacillus rhizosphaerae]